jgi:pimeloyl-ACP methyl ester carboxylesterase
MEIRKYSSIVFSALLITCVLLRVASASEQNDVRVIAVPTNNGTLAWKDVWREVVRQAGVEIHVPFPGSKTVDLNSRSGRWTLYGLNVLLKPDFHLKRDRERDRLLVEIDREAIRKRKQKLGSTLRTATAREDSALGLHYDRDKLQPDHIVLIVHGFASAPDELRNVEARLAAAGHATAQFGYRSRNGVQVAARDLSSALHEFAKNHPQVKVTIVAHSMGGLVSRWMLEHAELAPAPKCVVQLIMVATPNHGSDLAFPGLAGPPIRLPLVEIVPSRVGKLVSDITEEVNVSLRDLRPESKVLRHLNQLDRNSAVSYSIILGTRGNLNSEVPSAIDGLLRLHRRGRVERIVSEQFTYLRTQLGDEMLTGQGDGVVSLQSGLLDGVTDVLVLPMHHNDILRSTSSVFEDLLEGIEARIDRAPNGGRGE